MGPTRGWGLACMDHWLGQGRAEGKKKWQRFRRQNTGGV